MKIINSATTTITTKLQLCLCLQGCLNQEESKIKNLKRWKCSKFSERHYLCFDFFLPFLCEIKSIWKKMEYFILVWPEWFTCSKHVFMGLPVQSTMHYSQLGTVDCTSKTGLHWDFARFAQKIQTKLRRI